MYPATRSPLQKLLDVCFPNHLQHFNFLVTILATDSDPVPSLERLAAMKIVETVMTDPEKEDELLEVFEPDYIQAYVPILLGSCQAASLFVMEHVTLGLNLTFTLDEKSMHLETGAGTSIMKTFSSGYFPITKIYDLIFLILEREVERIEFSVEFGAADGRSEEISQKLVKFICDFGCLIALKTDDKYRLEEFDPTAAKIDFRIALATVAIEPVLFL